MKTILFVVPVAAVLAAGVSGSAFAADKRDVSAFDKAMAVEIGKRNPALKWIDGKDLPLEGKAFTDTKRFYDRLPKNLTTNVNAGVRGQQDNSAGLQFRFMTDADRIDIRWAPLHRGCDMYHMPLTGNSGVDAYYQDGTGRWRFARIGQIKHVDGKLIDGHLDGLCVGKNTPIIINLPLYNGVESFEIGIPSNCTVRALPPRKNGVNKPVVFYGTSITHGGCASRPGLAFPSIVGRELDVPIVNLGFSGSGRMEFEMSEHLAAIDASCYILDCLWNMGGVRKDTGVGGAFHDIKHPEVKNCVVIERYEPFIRNLRAKRPNVPIIMAEQCDVWCRPQSEKDLIIARLYDKLIAEGWKNLYYLPKTKMYSGDLEGTVDGCHPNDIGMQTMAKAFGGAVKQALGL